MRFLTVSPVRFVVHHDMPKTLTGCEEARTLSSAADRVTGTTKKPDVQGEMANLRNASCVGALIHSRTMQNLPIVQITRFRICKNSERVSRGTTS